MANDLPEGFVLDAPADANSALPEGFVLDQPSTGKTDEQVEQARLTQLEKVPEIVSVGLQSLLPDISSAQGMALASTMLLTPDPQEIANILTSASPDIGITQTPEGELIAVNNKTGATASINKPGASLMDAAQITGSIAAFTPAGRAGTAVGRSLGAIGTQAAIEGAQASQGGDFSPTDVAVAGAVDLAASAIPEAYRMVKRGRSDMPLLTETVETVTQPSAASVKQLAMSPDIDLARLESAKQLGLEEVLPTSTLATNPQYIEIEQGLTAKIGSELSASQKQAMDEVQKRADQLITEYGGSLESTSVGKDISNQMVNTIEDMRNVTRELYTTISEKVPPETRIDATELRRHLVAKARQLGGLDRLSAKERELLKMTKSGRRMTYRYIDEQRKAIGEMLRSAQKGQAFPDQTTFGLRELEDVFNTVQGQAIEPTAGKETLDLWNAANQSVAKRKDLESRAANLLGKELQKDIIPQLSGSMKSMAKGDTARFQKIIESIPADRREEAILTAMSDVMKARKEGISMPVFADWYKKIKNDPARYELISKYVRPEAMEFMDNLAKVSDGFAKALAEKPQTGRIMSLLSEFDKDSGVISKLLSLSGITGGNAIDMLANLSKQDPKTYERVSQLLGSNEFKIAAIRAAEGKKSPSIMNRPVVKQFLKGLPERTKREVLSVGLMQYLFGTETEDQQ